MWGGGARGGGMKGVGGLAHTHISLPVTRGADKQYCLLFTNDVPGEAAFIRRRWWRPSELQDNGTAAERRNGPEWRHSGLLHLAGSFLGILRAWLFVCLFVCSPRCGRVPLPPGRSVTATCCGPMTSTKYLDCPSHRVGSTQSVPNKFILRVTPLHFISFFLTGLILKCVAVLFFYIYTCDFRFEIGRMCFILLFVFL